MDEAKPARARRPWLRPLLAAVGYGAILVLAWRSIDRTLLLEGLARLRFEHLLAVLAVSLLHITGRALRFHWLVQRAGPNADYRLIDGFRIFLIGLSTSAVTPARAGDFIKAQLVRPYGIGGNVGVGVVMVERMLDLLVITSSIIVTGTMISERSASSAWRAGAWMLLACLVVGLVVVTVKRIRRQVFAILAGLAARVKKGLDRDKVETTLEGIFQVWDTVFVSPMSILSYALYSGGVWAIEFLKLWLVLHFLGAPVDMATVLFVYPVSIVAGIITILPFSEGVVGVTGVALLGTLAGVSTATATIAVVLDRGASSLPPLALWGVFHFWRASTRKTPNRSTSL